MSVIENWEFWGHDLRKVGQNARTDCVFCLGGGSLEVNLVEKTRKGKQVPIGFWKCWKCGKGGNWFTYLNNRAKLALEATNRADYARLSKDRGIRPEILKSWMMAYDRTLDTWLLPCFSLNKRLVNLYSWRQTEKGRLVMSSPDCVHHLYGLQKINKKKADTLVIVEGHWDAPALDDIVHQLGRQSEFDILANPGWGTFQPAWASVLSGRDVWLIGDNDESGVKGVKRVMDCTQEAVNGGTAPPTSMRFVEWKDKDPNDIRELLVRGAKPARIMSCLEDRTQSALVEAPSQTESVDSLPRKSIEELIADFEEVNLELAPAFLDSFLVALAVVLSSRITGGELLWVYLEGPPSSGKSTICESITCGRDYVYAMSKLTATSLVSGWKPAADEEGIKKDTSVLPMLDGLCLSIKDLTAILSLPTAVQHDLYGTFRDIYDGIYRTKYGTEEEIREYRSRFGIVAGVTYEIRGINNTGLGERFLHSCIVDEGVQSTLHGIDRNISALDRLEADIDGGEQGDVTSHLKACIRGLMDHFGEIWGTFTMPRLTQSQKRQIAAAAEFTSCMRSKVKRDFRDRVLLRPSREQGRRVSRQLGKMAVTLATLHQGEITDEIMRIVKKLAFDTSAGFTMDTMRVLIEDGPAKAGDLTQATGMDEANIRHCLRDMTSFGLVQSRRSSPKKPLVWSATPDVTELWHTIHNGEKL